MGVDTKGLTMNKVSIEDIYNVVKQLIDGEAKIKINKYPWGRMASVYFNYNEEERRLSISDSTDSNEYASLKFKSEIISWLSLGMWGSSVEIMQKIISQFGGYVDDNDCDDINWYRLEQSETEIKPVMKITMNDIYEKFGCIVDIIEE